jgi:tetratricopeptide (TPR) repeat protein
VLHRRVAEALERLHEGRLEEVSGVVAEHYEQAGHIEQAAAYFLRAVENATRTSYATADEYCVRALALIPATEHATRARLFLRRCRLYLPRGQYDLGRSALESALSELGHLEDSSAKTALLAETSILFSSIECETNNYSAAVSHAQEGLLLAQREPILPHLVGEAYLRWGMTAWRQGKMMEARAQLTQALHWARESGDETTETKALNDLAGTGMFSGMPAAEMLEYLYACLAIQERNGNLYDLADTYVKLGYVLLTQGTGRYEQAFAYHQKALALCTELGDRAIVRGALRSLGTLSVVAGDYASAQSQLDRALAASQETNDPFGEGIAWNLIGYLRYNIGDIAQAREYQEKSLHILESIGSRQRMGKTWSALSQIHAVLGNYGQALEHAERSVELGREMGEAREEAQALVCLGYTLIGLGRLGEARVAFERAYELRHRLGQTNRSMEPLAGLAQVALVEHDTSQMRERIEPILAHIRSHVMDKTEDTFQVYQVCYRVLDALGDPRAEEALRIAHGHLTERAASLSVEDDRIFWSVPGHREIMQVAATQRHAQ